MIRSKGEAGTGNIVEAVRHLRSILGDIRKITQADSAELYELGQASCRPRSAWCRRSPRPGTLPVPLFCAGGIATPADASLVMQLGAEAVFVGSGIFKSDEPGAAWPRPSSRPPPTSRDAAHPGQGQPPAWARPWPARRWTTLGVHLAERGW